MKGKNMERIDYWKRNYSADTEKQGCSWINLKHPIARDE